MSFTLKVFFLLTVSVACLGEEVVGVLETNVGSDVEDGSCLDEINRDAIAKQVAENFQEVFNESVKECKIKGRRPAHSDFSYHDTLFWYCYQVVDGGSTISSKGYRKTYFHRNDNCRTKFHHNGEYDEGWRDVTVRIDGKQKGRQDGYGNRRRKADKPFDLY